MNLTYRHTRNACFTGYVTQAIVNNLCPLLFLTFQQQDKPIEHGLFRELLCGGGQHPFA